MKRIIAQLVIDSTRDGFKAIVEHEKSKKRFYPSYPNNKVTVVVEKCSNERLYSALFSIGVRLAAERYEENIEMIARKFREELATKTNLCWDEVDYDGFYELINIKLNNDEK